MTLDIILKVAQAGIDAGIAKTKCEYGIHEVYKFLDSDAGNISYWVCVHCAKKVDEL